MSATAIPKAVTLERSNPTLDEARSQANASQSRRAERANPFKALWKTLNSTRFVIILLMVLAVASIGGVILGERFPTGFAGAEEHYRAEMGDGTFELLYRLGVFRPFSSFWFQSLLAVLAASLIACSVTRLKVTVRAALAMSYRRAPHEITSLTPHARIALHEPSHARAAPAATRAANGGQASEPARVPADPSVPSLVAGVLRRQRFKVRCEGLKDGVAIAASRGSISHTGPYLTHLGLLLLIAGGMVSGISGRTESVWLAPGETWQAMDKNFSVRLADFRMPQNARGELVQYVSTLEVIDTVRGGYTKEISVNHPLRHGGISLYQSSYELAAHRLTSATFTIDSGGGSSADGGAGQRVTLPFGAPTTLADGRTVAVEDFVSDFRMTAGGVESASSQMKNPAVRIALYENGAPVEAQWLFLQHPDFRHHDSRMADLRVVDVAPAYATGLTASTSPGSPFIWAGFVFASLGLILSFYLTHHRIWVVVGADAVYVGGASSGRRDAFRRQFAVVERALSSALHPGKAAA